MHIYGPWKLGTYDGRDTGRSVQYYRNPFHLCTDVKISLACILWLTKAIGRLPPEG
jgi:hypothetical protein